MSALRKLRQARLAHQQQQLNEAVAAEEEDDRSAAADATTADDRQPAINAFDLLDDDAEEAERGSSEEGGHGEVDVRREAAVAQVGGDEEDESGDEDAVAGTASAGSAAGATRRERQMRRGGKAQQSAKRSARGAVKGKSKDGRAAVQPSEEAEDDVDELLRSLDAEQRGSAVRERKEGERAQPIDAVDWAFLSTQQRHLDANTEVSYNLHSSPCPSSHLSLSLLTSPISAAPYADPRSIRFGCGAGAEGR